MEKDYVTPIFKNAIFGVGLQVIFVILSIFIRKIFITNLSIELIGLQDVFSNLFSFFSLCGFGYMTSISIHIFRFYAKKDKKDFQEFYLIRDKVSLLFVFVTFIIGTILIIFFNDYHVNIISKQTIYISFFIQLFLSSVSIFLMGGITILEADQKLYYVFIIDFVASMISYVVQIYSLAYSHNYLFYVVATYIKNPIVYLICSIIARKKYELLPIYTKMNRDKNLQIAKFAKQQVIYDLSDFVYNSTDAIVISKTIGLKMIGYYSNYNMIFYSIRILVSKVFNSFSNALNLIINSDEEEKPNTLYYHSIVCFIIMTFCIVNLIGLSDIFISLVYGAEYVQTVLKYTLSISLGILIIQEPFRSYLYHSGNSIYESKNLLVTAILNIMFSILLSYSVGVNGVVCGTIISSFYLLVTRIGVYCKVCDISYRTILLKNLKPIILSFLFIVISGILSYYNIYNIEYFIFLVVFNQILLLVYLIVLYYMSSEFEHIVNIILVKIRIAFRGK